MSQWAGMAYWRTPELEVGGARQGWDTKCSAELLASHWLTVKLRFAGGTREMGATGSSGSTTRQAYMPTLAYIHNKQPACCRVCLVGRCRVLWCDAGGTAANNVKRFVSSIRSLSATHKPLGMNRTPFDHTRVTTRQTDRQNRPPGHHLGSHRTQTKTTITKA